MLVNRCESAKRAMKRQLYVFTETQVDVRMKGTSVCLQM